MKYRDELIAAGLPYPLPFNHSYATFLGGLDETRGLRASMIHDSQLILHGMEQSHKACAKHPETCKVLCLDHFMAKNATQLVDAWRPPLAFFAIPPDPLAQLLERLRAYYTLLSEKNAEGNKHVTSGHEDRAHLRALAVELDKNHFGGAYAALDWCWRDERTGEVLAARPPRARARKVKNKVP